MKVVYFGTYRKNYVRNRMQIDGLRLVGVQVVECHQDLWSGIDDRIQAVTRGWRDCRLWLRLLRAYLHLIGKFFSLSDFDAVIVGYPGHLDIICASV